MSDEEETSDGPEIKFTENVPEEVKGLAISFAQLLAEHRLVGAVLVFIKPDGSYDVINGGVNETLVGLTAWLGERISQEMHEGVLMAPPEFRPTSHKN